MTISILAIDEITGRFGGAAATGSLCVGGWVLRGDPRRGMSASQGSKPSIFWGEDVLSRMGDSSAAAEAVAATVGPDPGRSERQLAALDPVGGTAVHTGADSIPACGHRVGPSVVVSGNLLSSETVLEACLQGYSDATGGFEDRLIAALKAAESEGGDSRGFLSAALLVLGRDRPPLTLRIDHDAAPVAALSALLGRTRQADYAAWLRTVPTLDDPHL